MSSLVLVLPLTVCTLLSGDFTLNEFLETYTPETAGSGCGTPMPGLDCVEGEKERLCLRSTTREALEEEQHESL
jgi:hypothetical protein